MQNQLFSWMFNWPLLQYGLLSGGGNELHPLPSAGGLWMDPSSCDRRRADLPPFYLCPVPSLLQCPPSTGMFVECWRDKMKRLWLINRRQLRSGSVGICWRDLPFRPIHGVLFSSRWPCSSAVQPSSPSSSIVTSVSWVFGCVQSWPQPQGSSCCWCCTAPCTGTSECILTVYTS